jgi:RNA polymerase sigma-70 factor (ECF subfamily)
MAVPTDELIRRYQEGQVDLFEALFDRFKDYVYRVAYSLVQHADEAEEVVQETFLDVLRALPRYQVGGPARFETWLYRVTTNRCKMRWRRKGPPMADWDEVGDQIAQLTDETSQHNPEEAVQQGEVCRRIWRAVGRLSPLYREVIVLRYAQELSYREIAETLKVSIGTVKSRLSAAHGKLQQLLEGGGDIDDRTPRQPKRGGRSFYLLVWLWSRTSRSGAESATGWFARSMAFG